MQWRLSEFPTQPKIQFENTLVAEKARDLDLEDLDLTPGSTSY